MPIRPLVDPGFHPLSLAQTGEPSMRGALGRADRTGQRGGGLGLGQVLDEAQHYDGAHPGR